MAGEARGTHRRSLQRARSGRRVLLILAPSFIRFPFPPWAIGTLVEHLRSLRCEVQLVDLHGQLSLFSRSNEEIAAIRATVEAQAVLRSIRTGAECEEPTASLVRAHLPSGGRFDLVGISCALGQPESYSFAVLVAKVCREMFDCPSIVGGEATQYGMLERLLPLLFEAGVVDWAARGPGSPTLSGLLGSGQDLAEIPGLIYLDEGGRVHRNSDGDERLSLAPDFSDIDFGPYKLEGGDDGTLDSRILPARFLLGCPFQCAFCKESLSRGIRGASPSEAVAAIRNMAERYGATGFHFLHSTINVTRGFFKEFCAKMVAGAPKVYWSDCARPDLFDAELAKAARACGAIRLVFGLETASPHLQKRIEKRLHMRSVAAGIRAAHNAGIWTALEIIVGFPGETERDVEATCEFLAVNDDWIDEVWINRFFVDVRSKMFSEPGRYGIAEVQDRRWIQADNPFEPVYPPVVFRTAGRSFQEEEEAAGAAYARVAAATSAHQGDAEAGVSSLALLFGHPGATRRFIASTLAGTGENVP